MGKAAHVCNRFDNDVSVIDLAAGKEIARVRSVREPIAAALTPMENTAGGRHLPNTRPTGISWRRGRWSPRRHAHRRTMPSRYHK
jgi:YVTN family beta-propeller protein